VRTITRFDPSPFRSHVAAEIPDFRPDDHLDRKSVKRYDRFSQLGVTAAPGGIDLEEAELGESAVGHRGHDSASDAGGPRVGVGARTPV